MKIYSFTRGYTMREYNNFKDMKTKRKFVSPRVTAASIDLEGLICESIQFLMQADELKNMNVTRGGVPHDGPGSEHYFEF